MQERIAVLLTLALSVVPGVAAEASVLHFTPPATIGGAVHAEGIEWAIVLMEEPGTESSIAGGTFSLKEIAVQYVGETRVAGVNGGGQPSETETAQPDTPPAFSLASAGPSSLYAEGHLNITLSSVEAVIEIPGGRCLDWRLQSEDVNRAARSDRLCPATWPAVMAQMTPESALDLQGSVHHLQWHGMTTSCAAEECPPGGDRQTTSAPLPPPNYAHARRYAYEDATGGNASLRSTGAAALVLFGGSSLDLDIQGWMRLPLASGQAACATCLAPENQTFFASGDLSLHELKLDGQGGLESQVGGDYATVRFDEAAIDPELLLPVLGGAAVAATAIVGAVLAKLLLPALFTRRTEDKLLLNERRRRLLQVIEQNPGIHFRGALALAELPSGSGRFHLTQLVRNGLVKEKHIGSNLRLFARATPSSGWAAPDALRNQNLRPIVEWVAGHPECTQKEILAAVQGTQGSNKSTTQARIARLVKNGVLQSRRDGRVCRYRVAVPLALESQSPASVEAEQTTV